MSTRTPFRRRGLAGLLGLAGITLLVASSLGAPTAAAMSEADRDAARARIETLGADLAELADRADSMAPRERVEAASDVVRDSFDLRAIAAATIGRATYQDWSEDQRAAYVDAFIRYTLASQTSALTQYEADKLAITSVEAAPGGLVMVRTRYEGGEGATVDFMLADEAGDGFLIVDLVVDGAISQLKLRRAEFSSVLKQKGYDGLIETLRQKTDQLVARDG